MIKQKDLIIKRFRKSLEHYETEAIVQKEMAIHLIEYLIKLKGKNFDNILEIGCGVGILTKEIFKNFMFKKFYVNDIVTECNQYIKEISPDIVFIDGDIENINIFGNYNLIISNATFQWLNHPKNFFKKIYLSLEEQGTLCFSTFGKKNFLEFQELSYPMLKYYDSEEIRKMAFPYFKLKYFEEKMKEVYFSSVMGVLNHIRNTGANGIMRFRWSFSSLSKFIKEYENRFVTSKGIALTYNPVYYYFERI